MKNGLRAIRIALFLVVGGVSMNAGATTPLTPGERKLCIDVCYKQLACAGQGANTRALETCRNGCEQSLSTRDPQLMKPWRALGACSRSACGEKLAKCVNKKMSKTSPTERKCKKSCDKTLRCQGQLGNVVARQMCERDCMIAMVSKSSHAYQLQSARMSCSRKSCGLKTEACVAKKLGGDNKRCGQYCEHHLICANKTTGRDFQICMPQCISALKKPGVARRVELELKCKNKCGFKLESCVAKKLGGKYPFCDRACSKQLTCGGNGTNVTALRQCTSACVGAVASGNPDHVRGYEAIENCRKKECGYAFNNCLYNKMSQRAPIAKPQIVAPKPDPKLLRCQGLCNKRAICDKGTNMSACNSRCLHDKEAKREFKALEKCRDLACGSDLDRCVMKALRIPRKQMKCFDLCSKEMGCVALSPGLRYSALSGCLKTCSSRDPKHIKSAKLCLTKKCGLEYGQCLERGGKPVQVAATQIPKRTAPVTPKPVVQAPLPPVVAPPIKKAPVTIPSKATVPPTKVPVVARQASRPVPTTPTPVMRPPVVDKKRSKCQEMCNRAIKCNTTHEEFALCETRCLSSRAAKKEFKLRARCGKKQTCGDYETCLLKGLKVSKRKMACVSACRHDLECDKKRGKDIAAIAQCARACNRDPKELRAVSMCSAAGCGTAFTICVSAKLKAMAPKPAPAKKSAKELAKERCESICNKASECADQSIGDSCVNRCLGRQDVREFKARERCNERQCGSYLTCVLRDMGVPASKMKCVRSCSHDLECAPIDQKRDLGALVSCTKRCKYSRKEISAIGECAELGCGKKFRQCFLDKSGRMAGIKKLETRCKAMCTKAEKCSKGTGGDRCLIRCVESQAVSSEFLARQSCLSRSCAETENCLLNQLGIKSSQRRCLKSCQWDLSCGRNNKAGDLALVKACVLGCKLTDREIEVRRDCQAEGCGTRFESCVKKGLKAASAPPADLTRLMSDKTSPEAANSGIKTPVAEVPLRSPTDIEKQCEQSCAQAAKCDLDGDAKTCVKRCIQSKGMSASSKALMQCNNVKANCGKYSVCVLATMGLKTETSRRCIGKCKKELRCESPAKTHLDDLVSCARSCTAQKVQLDASASCRDQACGKPYNKCVETKVSASTLTPEQKRCISLCEQAEKCTAGTGGDTCVARCNDGTRGSTEEFNAREKCKGQQCQQYEQCVLKIILGEEEAPSVPSKPAPKKVDKPAPKKVDNSAPKK